MGSNERIISKFLFFPKTISGERKWFKRVKIKQTSERMFDVTSGASWVEWNDIGWVDC